MLHDASILITGGTGSFGNTFVAMTLARYTPRRIVVFSRDEMKQWEIARKFGDDPRVRFFIGDARDKGSASRKCCSITRRRPRASGTATSWKSARVFFNQP